MKKYIIIAGVNGVGKTVQIFLKLEKLQFGYCISI